MQESEQKVYFWNRFSCIWAAWGGSGFGGMRYAQAASEGTGLPLYARVQPAFFCSKKCVFLAYVTFWVPKCGLSNYK